MNISPSILIIDDRIALCKSLAESLSARGYSALIATSADEALLLFKKDCPDAVLLDVMLGEDNGLDLLPKLLQLTPMIPIIIITAYGTVEAAVSAIKLGAFDYIQKPIKTEKLLKVLENALKLASLEKENAKLKNLQGINDLVSESPMMKEMLSNLRRLSISNLPILLRGESGVGKDILADFIHRNSSRISHPIQKINCAAFPESLLDNELFGHEKGSFTGANTSFPGIFERSHEGTLFLDEIGDMPLSIQTKILRAIQNKEIRRIGGTDTIHVDIRFIAATNQDLESMVAKGSFRNDLLYRLNTATIVIPPLRERKEDIPLLITRFLTDATLENNTRIKQVSDEALLYLKEYSWPGNIRELKSAIEYASAVSMHNEIHICDLPIAIKEEPKPNTELNIRASMERELVEKTLRDERFNKTAAAAKLGMSRATLYNKLKKYGMDYE